MPTPLDEPTVAKAATSYAGRAEAHLRDPDKAARLAEAALNKARRVERSDGALRRSWRRLTGSARMVLATARGQYRAVPWQSLLMAAGALLYFVAPLDLVPDILLGFGLIDDAAVIAWTLRTIGGDVDTFLEWEAAGRPLQTPTAEG